MYALPCPFHKRRPPSVPISRLLLVSCPHSRIYIVLRFATLRQLGTHIHPVNHSRTPPRPALSHSSSSLLIPHRPPRNLTTAFHSPSLHQPHITLGSSYLKHHRATIRISLISPSSGLTTSHTQTQLSLLYKATHPTTSSCSAHQASRASAPPCQKAKTQCKSLSRPFPAQTVCSHSSRFHGIPRFGTKLLD